MKTTVSDPLNANTFAAALARQEAQRDALFAGLTSGLTGALLGSKFMGFNRNKTIFCGILTGILSGYLFHQGFLSSNMARLKDQEEFGTDRDHTDSHGQHPLPS